MKKFKVLLVHNFYKIPGGEDTVFLNEKELLKKNGHEIVTYTRSNEDIKWKIFGSVRLFLLTFFSIKTYKEVKKIIKDNNVDIVHVHNTLPLISPSVYYAAFSLGVPVVQTIHNFRLLCPCGVLYRDEHICEECLNQGLRCSLKHKCYRESFFQTFTVALLLKLHRVIGTYNKVNGYIALTEFNKEKLSNILDSRKIYVKPNFVFKTKGEDEVKNFNIYEQYFVYIGRVEKLKGIYLLIKAFEELNTIKLYIVGNGPEFCRIENYLKERKIRNIELLGFRKREVVFEILRGSTAIILPSQCYEGFPMTILEGFSLGVPVIAGDVGNFTSIIKNEYNGLLFKYNSYVDLKEKIELLNSNSELQHKLKIGAAESNKKYNDKSNYNTLISIYNDVKREINGQV